ncbi:MAG: hypothetical protein CBB66_00505 [bacterium TMED6]|nr:MAG: hypothetical protein CBB66_00505 [bacterium TMED6]
MIKFSLIIYFLISFLYSQVVSTELIEKVNIKNIPIELPAITTFDFNISFHDIAIKKLTQDGVFSYLKIKSLLEGNYQIRISDSYIPDQGYIAFFDQNKNTIYGPYTNVNGSNFYSSVLNSKEIVIIYFEPFESINKGSLTIDKIESIENIIYPLDTKNYKLEETRERPVLMVTGYWPPTNEMIRHFSQDINLNPEGWQGENWRNSGFDIVSFFPEFNPPDCSNCGQGYGDLEVDYQDTSLDFWRIIDEVKPTGIITFSRGFNNNSWELESNVYNWINWYADYTSPLYPTPSPPDDSFSDNGNRGTALPITLIEEALDNSDIDVNCYVDQNGDSGRFLSEFMGYHGMWYHQSSLDSENPCLLGGHIHVGGQLSVRMATDAAELTIETVLEYLDNILIIPGDINDDELLNIQDIIQLIIYILDDIEPNEDWLTLADLNNDGNINIQDLILIVEIILN